MTGDRFSMLHKEKDKPSAKSIIVNGINECYDYFELNGIERFKIKKMRL